MRRLSVRTESWPIRGSFTISRGSRVAAEVVVVEITDGDAVGRGECVPYARYGETVAGTLAQIDAMAGPLAEGLDRTGLPEFLAAGAARNAVDCALWDLEAKRTGQPVWQLAGLARPQPLTTVYTISLDTPDAMAVAARAVDHRPILKLKLGGPAAEDVERVRAVRAVVPDCRLVADANEAWTVDDVDTCAPALAELGVEMIEQPVPAGHDEELASVHCPVPLCADESCHDRATVPPLIGRYQMVNIKLDKTGGLTEALKLAATARKAGLQIMVGCMISTSLAMAPAVLVAQGAVVVDLDGPLLLARDREPGLTYRAAEVLPADPALWG
ncbi:MAG: dipeptide epimerase [Rhodospirillaceae bacterium]|nr:dipeptide epimerase [Rhodospirillaceae bacterium]MCA8931930.1 dipeptide epimerase [Rhodospirillaceae bacterium]